VSLRACQNTKKALEKMKRLLIALVAAVAVSTGFARVTDKQSFESSFDDFEPSVADEDDSALAAYNNDAPTYVTPPYDFANYEYGQRYLSLDTGDATLWRTNSGEAAYFDMVMQFNPSATAPEIDEDTKIAVYVGSDEQGNPQLFVLSGDEHGNVVTNMAGVSFNTSNWIRLTIASNNGMFYLYANGVAEPCGPYYPLPGKDATIKSVGFKGSGKLDDFVARTTNPFFNNENAVVSIGGLTGERYASLEDAIADNPTATPQLEANTSLATPLAYGESISVKLNNHTLSGITTGSLVALESTSSGVTTYTAGYFPRTATAGQDGTAANPYEIADADDLVALQDAILADAANGTTFASKSYVQTANIDMTGVDGFYGIGWFDSSTSFASVPSGVASDGKTALPFAGTYNGQGYTNSNVTIVKHSYAGVFNNVSGTVKDLTVQDIGLSGTCSEWGCAIVGNAGDGSLLENLTAVTSTGFDWGSSANHNVAGIVVRPIGTATIRGCVNNANISSTSKRLGGIASFVGSKVEGTVFDSCTNNATLVSTDGTRGVGGILGCAEGGLETGPTAVATIIRNCADFGSETAQGSGGHAGAIVGSNWNGAYTYTDDGGNTFKASTVDCGYVKNAVFGRAYAVDAGIDNEGNSYLTTVKQADLAAGNTYILLADVAASETPVFTLAAAGDTIAFDTAKGFTFAGNVAVDTTTLVLATPVTEGTVTTYSATAGVASVNDVAYATFDEAVAAVASAPEGKQYVTLLADVAKTFDTDIVIAVKLNGHTFTPTEAGSIFVTESTNGSTGITTYTAATLVAKVGTQKFATLQAAIAAADAGATKTVDLVGAATGAVTIPDGITVAVAASSSLSDVSSLAGSGVLYADSPAALQIVNAKSGLFSASDWEGVVSLANLDISAAIDLTRFGNANSVVRFNNAGCAFTTGSTTAHAIKALEVGPNGLDLIGNYSAGTFTFPCALTGTGNLKIAAKNSQYGTDLKVVKFTGDVSGFTGSINFDSDANCAVYFGESEGNGNCISVAADKSVTVAAGKTWTAPGGFVVRGNMTVNGTLDAGSEKLYGNGTITFNAATSLVVAGSWTGRYIANFKADNAAIFYIPENAAATTMIIGVNGEFGGYPRFGDGAPEVKGPVTLDANWTIANGWYGTDYTTKFAKLSGSGDLTVNGTTSGDSGIYYTITELDGYTGTLGGRRGYFTIGKVNVATPPANGARVVKIAIGANGSMLSDDVPLYVGGVDSGATLTYEVAGASGEGLYYHAPVFDVRFYKDAGKTEQIGDTQSVVSGEKATAPEAPTKTGYTFTGWNPDTNAVIEAATDFVAQWSADGYTITFDANGGSVDPATTNFTIESGTITLPTPTGLMGATFGGWTNETYVTPITEFTPAAATLGNFTLFAKWTPSGNPQTIDPTDSTSTATVAATDEDEAISKTSLSTPSGVDADEYKANFDFTASPNGDGTFTVTLTGIKEEVKADVSADAVGVLNSDSGTGDVDVPAGLYYRITRYTALGTPASETPATGRSDGEGVPVVKPGETQGFIKVEMSTTPFGD